jgi:hypothetical protein
MDLGYGGWPPEPSGDSSSATAREPQGDCPNSPDGIHHHVVVSCEQSVQHFVCQHCPDNFYD